MFAYGFLHRDQLSEILRGRASITGLLGELIDAHELVLSTAQPAATDDGQAEHSWARDFAARLADFLYVRRPRSRDTLRRSS